MKRIICVIACLGFAACGADDGTGTPPADDIGADANTPDDTTGQGDTTADTAADTAVDTAVDTGPDTGPDTGGDAADADEIVEPECTDDADCDDGMICTTNTCTDGECVFQAIAGCCSDDAACDDGDECTDDSCEANANACVNVLNGTCCAEDTDCDDGDLCTTDACDAGLCANLSTGVEGCCNADVDCDDGDLCTTDKCSLENVCGAIAIVGCCNVDDDCEDGNPCTTSTCNAANACDDVTLADETACGDALVCYEGACIDDPVCGDGVQGFNEACDDGNTKPGDGCSMTCGVESFNVGDIIFTEFMANPSQVLDADGEWIELYNTTGEDIDINGWHLAESNKNPHIIWSDEPVIVPAGGYLILTLTCDPAGNGGIEPGYCYEGGIVDEVVNPLIILNNDVDQVSLSWNAQVIDTLDYDDSAGWSVGNGVSTQLSAGLLDGVSNNLGTNWCAATEPYGDGDLGTPGTANATCP